MRFTMPGLKPTQITDGLGGSTFNSKHLVSTYGLDKPADLSLNATNMAQIFSATDRYNDKPILGMTEAKGKKLYLSSNIFTWKLRGNQRQTLRVVEVVETSVRPGENGAEITVVLDRDWFKYPDVVIPQHPDYPLAVIGRPRPRATGYEYKMKLITSNPSRYLPTDLIAVGQEFSKKSTRIAEEMNQDYGTMQFNSVFQLRSQLGYVAEEVKFSDRALRVDKNGNENKVLKHWRVPFLDNDGNTYYNFMPMAEAEMWNNVMMDIDWGLTYGRMSTDVGPDKYTIRTGPGYREQFEYTNTLYHNNNLTLAELDEWFESIFRGRKDANANSRKVVLVTGERGALMFDQMVASEASSFLTVDSHYIRDGKAIFGEGFKHLAFGAQFTQYQGKNGVNISVMINPQYDDPDFCPVMHPVFTDIPIDSWRMDLFDLGSTAEYGTGAFGDNMQMVCEKFSDHYFSSTGKWDPKSGMPINDGSEGLAGGVGGYSMHVEKSYGLLIRDISRCGRIILDFDV